MPEMIAQGIQPAHRWRRSLPADRPIELGRTTPTMAVSWDSLVSRRHVRLNFHQGRVSVRRLENAANPVFFNGSQEDDFWLSPGEHFVIGETTFTLTSDRAEATLDVPNPISQKTYTHEFLRNVSYRDADRRIEVLNQLPDLISDANNQSELLTRIVNTLLAGIQSASSVAIVRSNDPNSTSQDDLPLQVLHWDRRGVSGGDFQPSARLIRQTLESDQSVLHIWNQSRRRSAQATEGSPATASLTPYTFDFQNDWAFCVPLTSQATEGWVVYVTGTNSQTGTGSGGSGSGSADLQGDIKFCELVGTTLGNLLWMQRLERRQASLRNFFSPVVLEALAGQDPEVALAPRQCRVSVLFCDLRGFSRASEKMADNLEELLEQVSDSLGVTTQSILEHGGVIGDFHGDSAMGFWGWPLDQEETAIRAIEAACEIREKFSGLALGRNLDENAFGNFQIGLGIATGQAVAGKIGTQDQVKVTAFGPVVNLASRLEGLTRWLDVNVLIDPVTATEARASNPDIQTRKNRHLSASRSGKLNRRLPTTGRR